MSAKKWGEINYEAVPSKANLVYNNAFLKNDEERRREYLDKLEKGEAKINSSTNFPHDIVHSYLKGRSYYRSNIKEDKALEALWKALPDTVQGDGNTIVVRVLIQTAALLHWKSQQHLLFTSLRDVLANSKITLSHSVQDLS